MVVVKAKEMVVVKAKKLEGYGEILVKGGGKEILAVLCENASPVEVHDGVEFESYQLNLIDVKRDKLLVKSSSSSSSSKPILPSLLNCFVMPRLTKLGSSVYVMGGLPDRSDPKIPLLVEANAVASDDQPNHLKDQSGYYYTGSLRVDLSDKQNLWWRQAPLPLNDDYFFPYCAGLRGKIYGFGSNLLKPAVLDPGADDVWKYVDEYPLPYSIHDALITIPVIPDPRNGRILLHLSGGNLSSPCVYAYYPQGRRPSHKWELIARGFCGWTVTATLADDGIIYFHDYDSGLSAYDLAKRKWLDVSWSFKEIAGENVVWCRYNNIYSLGNGLLCMVTWYPSYQLVEKKDRKEPEYCHVSIFKFRVDRHTADVEHIIATPIFVQEIEIPSCRHVYDFLLLKGALC